MKVEEKITRLIEIISEAKSIIRGLEFVMTEFEKFSDTGCSDFDKIKNTPVSAIRFENQSQQTRFIRAVKYNYGVNTLGDLLLDCDTITLKQCRGLGAKTIDVARKAIKEQFGINWV